MSELTLHRALVHRTKELTAWQLGAIGLLVLASLYSAAATAALLDARAKLADQAAQLQQAEHTRDLAIQEMRILALQAEQAQQAAENRLAASEGGYTYVGECVITSYCPCEVCCGRWADGLTATGLPAEPGIVAVDPDVIPLGSTVVINNQQYLAADVGVKGLAIDICVAGHQEAQAYGVQRQEVWLSAP